MDIRFLGTGGAFHVDQGNSAALVRFNGLCVLLDCGHSVFPNLVKKGLAEEVDAILVTHLHDDHVGSLSSMLLYHQLVLQKGPATVIVPNSDFQALLEGFLSYSLGPNSGRVQFKLVSDVPGLTAVDTFGLHVKGMPTWGYIFQEGQQSIAFSGDLGDPAPFFEALGAMDLPGLRVFHEVSFLPQVAAHTHYKDLEAYMADWDIYGYHCSLPMRPSDLRLKLVADHPELLAW